MQKNVGIRKEVRTTSSDKTGKSMKKSKKAKNHETLIFDPHLYSSKTCNICGKDVSLQDVEKICNDGHKAHPECLRPYSEELLKKLRHPNRWLIRGWTKSFLTKSIDSLVGEKDKGILNYAHFDNYSVIK